MLAGLLAIAGQSAGQAAPHAHEHGVADAEIAVDGERVTIVLRVPLDSLVGFESAPRTAQQRERVRAMAARLHAPDTLVAPTAAAGCAVRPAALAAPAIPADLLAAPDGEAALPARAAGRPDRKTASKHADLEATWAFDCRRADALTGLSFAGLFGAFDDLHRIRAAAVTARGQSGALLTPARPRIAW